MKTTFTRRIVAAISAAGLLLVGAPLAAGPAQAATACAAGATVRGSPHGLPRLDGLHHQDAVEVQRHGADVQPRVPHLHADPGGPRGAAGPARRARRTRRSRSRRSPPVFGTDVAYIGSGVADVAPSPQVGGEAARPGLRPGRGRLLTTGLGHRGVGPGQ